MNLKDISKEELETMGYDEIALLILQNNGKKMKLFDLFKKVCEVLELPENTVEDRISDFFELLSINKKFILLDDGYWDLAVNHMHNIVVEDEDLEDTEEVEETDDDNAIDEEEENEDEDIFYDSELDNDDEEEDDLKDLLIIDDEENLQE